MSVELARSMSGHDKNQVYLIKEKDERFVYLVNGTTKTLAKPKKKSEKHIQIIRKLPVEVAECFDGALTDNTIKKAIRQYNRIKDTV